uniref:Chemosensory protein n=1 Tax=Blattella germanica TaxID=6973 RepID=A0A0X8DCA9_BLAGE|nr:chemosensory protein [Blattella germanica]
MEYINLLICTFIVCANVLGQQTSNTSGESGHTNTNFFSQCCPDTGMSKNFTIEEIEMQKQCYSDAIKDEHVKDGKPIYGCVSQCYGEKKGVVDREGSVISEAFVQQVLELYTDESIKNVVRTVAPKCVEHCNAHSKALRAKDPNTYSCSPAMTLVNLCTYVEIETNCPSEIRISSEKCEASRNSMIKMKNTMFP